MKPDEFIAALLPGVQNLQKKTGLFSSLTLAQAALETGWGKFIPADKDTGKVSNNLFGIKGTGPAGSVICGTEEENPDGSRIKR
ncbi:MAG: glucosaminidase domain-containing protein [Eubacteriales bacterium]|jgi:flagellum-specific peptidoglycan hydrolase FlgJ